MTQLSLSDKSPGAVIHVDLDGARHIYAAHGWRYTMADDPLFESGLRGALDVLQAARATATLFVIAEDLEDPRKYPLLERAVAAGHEIASHSVTHRRLTRLDSESKRREIFESRDRLSAALGVDVVGFRAPGFQVDPESLALIEEAGYAYDSSMLTGRLAPSGSPTQASPPLLELHVPALGPLAWPFHPSYSLVVGDWYFGAGLRAFRRRKAPMVLLYHLTDFADPLPAARLSHWRQKLFTLSHRSGDEKRRRCAAMLDLVRRHFTMTTTSEWMEYVRARPSMGAARDES